MGEETGEENTSNKEQEVNNLDDGEVEACDRVVTMGDQEELEELEQSLQALERLDRSSPDLWPDQFLEFTNSCPPPLDQVRVKRFRENICKTCPVKILRPSCSWVDCLCPN